MEVSREWLVLVPTNYELERLPKTKFANIELCGFGPIAAAARTAFLIKQYQPRNILLLGIAGGFDEALVTTALEFGSVVCDGIGVGDGDAFQSAAEIGWHQWSEENPLLEIGDKIQLATSSPKRLLTVCSASADAVQAARRQLHFSVDAEDMEGFGVAMSCKMAGVPLRVVRGISNVVGDRYKANWKVNEALTAAEKLAVKIIEDAR